MWSKALGPRALPLSDWLVVGHTLQRWDANADYPEAQGKEVRDAEKTPWIQTDRQTDRILSSLLPLRHSL